MEVTLWILHHVSYLMELGQGNYLVEPTPWKLPHETYIIEVT